MVLENNPVDPTLTLENIQLHNTVCILSLWVEIFFKLKTGHSINIRATRHIQSSASERKLWTSGYFIPQIILIKQSMCSVLGLSWVESGVTEGLNV